jgi:hypothetical protein
VLPADAELDPGPHFAAFLDSYPYEPTYPLSVKNLKRIVGENTPLNVKW